MSRFNFDHCRRRDAEIFDLATRHPIIAAHVLNKFASPSACYRRLGTLRERGKLKYVGSVQLRDTGRPQDVYCNGWSVNTRHLFHEIKETDFLRCYEPDAQIVRDPSRVDQRINPDAEVIFPKTGRFFFVEIDTGTEDLGFVVDKWRRIYSKVREFLLVVTLSPVRMQHLIERAEQVKEIALFSTLDAVLADPHGPVYCDAYGETGAI